MIAQTLDDLLRDPAEVARRCTDDDGLRDLLQTSLLVLLFGGIAFGAVLGSFRGELQILFASVKVPLALLTALIVSTPALHGLSAALGRPLPLRSVVTLAIAASARSALVLVAFAPVLWLAIDLGASYHQSALLAAAFYLAGGVSSLGVLLRGLGGLRQAWLTAFLFVGLFGVVGGQSAWLFRPYLGRPTHDEVPFFREREGGFVRAVGMNTTSSLGIYRASSEAAPTSPVEERRLQEDRSEAPPLSWEPQR